VTCPDADITVLIVAFRSRDTLPGVLAGLARQTVAPARVQVLENGSPREEAVDEALVAGRAELVVSSTNLGFAAGNNVLAARTETDWLFMLNPDAYPSGTLIADLQAAVKRYPEIPIFGCTQYAHDTPGVLDGAGDVYHFTGLPYRAGQGKVLTAPPEGEVFGPCGAATLIRRDLFEALGGYDKDYFCYVEDVDLAYRARLRGARCIQLRCPSVSHVGHASSGRRSAFAAYHGARNRFWTFFKNTPLALMPMLAPVHLGVTVLLWLSAARFGQFTLFGKAIKNALAGWPDLMEKRRAVQRERRVSIWTIARAFTWSPFKLLTRGVDVRP